MTLRLPAHLRAPGPDRRREEGAVRHVAGGEVRQAHVLLPRHGWRHEVTVTYDAHDHEGRVRRTDSVWVASSEDADRLARAAAHALGRPPFAGLSAIAEDVRVRTIRVL